MTLNLEQVINLKKELNDRFNVVLHFHDACGKQSFSFDDIPDNKVIEFLENYFMRMKSKAIFDRDNRHFTL
jgi:hypothetical protein